MRRPRKHGGASGYRGPMRADFRGSCRILVVDDEPGVRRADGADALRLLQEEVPDVDAVLSDIVMPRLPVLLMSGYASAELEGMGIAAPCAILTKPFAPECLVQELRRCLRGAGV
jgi:DNA-binding response OmpR family regulator